MGRICSHCHKVLVQPLLCSQCKHVAYCGSECQSAHWTRQHKHECTIIAAAATVPLSRLEDMPVMKVEPPKVTIAPKSKRQSELVDLIHKSPAWTEYINQINQWRGETAAMATVIDKEWRRILNRLRVNPVAIATIDQQISKAAANYGAMANLENTMEEMDGNEFNRMQAAQDEATLTLLMSLPNVDRVSLVKQKLEEQNNQAISALADMAFDEVKLLIEQRPDLLDELAADIDESKPSETEDIGFGLESVVPLYSVAMKAFKSCRSVINGAMRNEYARDKKTREKQQLRAGYTMYRAARTMTGVDFAERLGELTGQDLTTRQVDELMMTRGYFNRVLDRLNQEMDVDFKLPVFKEDERRSTRDNNYLEGFTDGRWNALAIKKGGRPSKKQVERLFKYNDIHLQAHVKYVEAYLEGFNNGYQQEIILGRGISGIDFKWWFLTMNQVFGAVIAAFMGYKAFPFVIDKFVDVVGSFRKALGELTEQVDDIKQAIAVAQDQVAKVAKERNAVEEAGEKLAEESDNPYIALKRPDNAIRSLGMQPVKEHVTALLSARSEALLENYKKSMEEMKQRNLPIPMPDSDSPLVESGGSTAVMPITVGGVELTYEELKEQPSNLIFRQEQLPIKVPKSLSRKLADLNDMHDTIQNSNDPRELAEEIAVLNADLESVREITGMKDLERKLERYDALKVAYAQQVAFAANANKGLAKALKQVEDLSEDLQRQEAQVGMKSLEGQHRDIAQMMRKWVYDGTKSQTIATLADNHIFSQVAVAQRAAVSVFNSPVYQDMKVALGRGGVEFLSSFGTVMGDISVAFYLAFSKLSQILLVTRIVGKMAAGVFYGLAKVFDRLTNAMLPNFASMDFAQQLEILNRSRLADPGKSSALPYFTTTLAFLTRTTGRLVEGASEGIGWFSWALSGTLLATSIIGFMMSIWYGTGAYLAIIPILGKIGGAMVAASITLTAIVHAVAAVLYCCAPERIYSHAFRLAECMRMSMLNVAATGLGYWALTHDAFAYGWRQLINIGIETKDILWTHGFRVFN